MWEDHPGSWWRSDPSPFSCRYLYNRLGYWSDWSVPILMTTVAAFTYIAGLLVREAALRGRETWPVSALEGPNQQEAGFSLGFLGCCISGAWFLQGGRSLCFCSILECFSLTHC